MNRLEPQLVSSLILLASVLVMGCTRGSDVQEEDRRLDRLVTDHFRLQDEENHLVIIPSLHCAPCIQYSMDWLGSETHEAIKSQYLFLTPVREVHERLTRSGFESVLDSAAYIDRLNFGLYNLTVIYRKMGIVDSVYRLPSKDVGRIAELFPVLEE